MTKEEADLFVNRIERKYRILDGGLHKIVNEFTEKSELEIRPGDIYRDKEGFIVEIIHEDIAGVAVHPVGVMSKCGYVYNKFNGKYMGDFDRADLNLSKRYKLVEAEDECQECRCDLGDKYKFVSLCGNCQVKRNPVIISDMD